MGKERKISIQTVTKVNRTKTVMRVENVAVPIKGRADDFAFDVMICSNGSLKAIVSAIML
jgi:hypothetical protein